MTASKTRTTRKLLGSLGVVGAAAAVAGMGTFGTFTDSTTPLNASVSSGTLSLDLSAKNAALSLTVTDMVPGDSISRAFDLVNSGKTAFGGIAMTTTATTSSILDSDKVNGLKLTVKSCSGAWTEATTATGTTYSCNGTTGTVVDSTAVTNANLTAPASLNVGGSDHLVLTLTLPEGAGNEFQGKSSALSITFTGTQKTGTAR